MKVSLACALVLTSVAAFFLYLEITSVGVLPRKVSLAPGFVLALGIWWIIDDVTDLMKQR
jgi:hypothetical protein